MKQIIQITEEMHIEKEWFDQAKNQTLETLPGFISHVMNDYMHDYGTVCHAISACAIAAAWAANEEKGACGGITGFQAGFVMWDFVKQWSFSDNKCGMRIIDYDEMLYPQYDDMLDKTISPHVWSALQKEAKERLEREHGACDRVIDHWKSIAEGKVPFGCTVKEG